MKPRAIFGLAALGLILWVPALTARGRVIVTTLYSFSGTNGINPEGQLVEGPSGCFYGTTRDTAAQGGGSGFGKYGHGTVFKITKAGALTTLFRFNRTNGAFPRAGLVLGRDGDFYGTTAGGGANEDDQLRCGTVFEMTSDGVITTLASLQSDDGAFPRAGLVEGKDGILFGTAPFGGLRAEGAPPNWSPDNVKFDYGTVFKVTTNSGLAPIFRFAGHNGANPYSRLIKGLDGNFYGTTAKGGAKGAGTVFTISANGDFKTLFHFGGTDGSGPNELTQRSDGYLYGTTSAGGLMSEGTIFRMTPAGDLTTLASFNGTHGGHPASPLVMGANGKFYGTTVSGGANNEGTIFKLASNGVVTMEYSFSNGCLSAPNLSTLTRGTDGNLYGTTTGEGQYRCGSIFRVTLDSSVAGVKRAVQTSGPSHGVRVSETITSQKIPELDFGKASSRSSASASASGKNSMKKSGPIQSNSPSTTVPQIQNSTVAPHN